MSAGVIAAHYADAAGGFQPTDLSGLMVWFAARAVSGVTSGAAFTQWNDLSGNSNHGTSDGDTLWFSSGGAGGGARVRFAPGGNGVATGFALPVGLMSGKAAGEAFATVKVDNNAVENSHWKFGSAGSNNHFPFQDNNIYDDFGSTVRKGPIAPGAQTLTSWRRYNVWSAANDWTARLDEVTVSTTTTNTVGWRSTAQRIGAMGGFNHGGSDYGCFLLFDRKLTPAERAQVVAWLQANPSG